MKNLKPHSLALSLMLLGVSFPSYAQLMFSQYIDGSANRKGLEIFNPDAETVNLADYEIQLFNNGAVTTSLKVPLKGSLSSQEKYLIGRTELQKILGDQVKQIAGLNFNGDDAVLLMYKGTAVDRFGRVGEYPKNLGWGSQTKSFNQSFSRRSNTNSVTSIDPKAPFDLDRAWTVWDDRNNFNQYLGRPTQPPVTENISCRSTDTPIADLHQAALNQRYIVRGVITADYRYANGMSGFYVQTQDSKAKPNLSNAIFVYIPTSSAVKGGKAGEEVLLSGRLTQFENQLQIDQVNQDILSCHPQAAQQIQPLELNLPFESLTANSGNAPKRYQGMWVKLPQTLTVSENYDYGRYGQLALTLGRHYIPTNLYPANAQQAKDLAQANTLSKIIFDDGSNAQNMTPWLPQMFSAANTLRSGYQLKNVEGILEYRFNAWRIQPIADKTLPEVIPSSNPRTKLQAKDPKHIRVAAFNVLNYDNGKSKGFPTERGASSKAEFDRQHAKIVSALQAIDADVYALMEIGNNGYDEKSAIAYLTQALGADWKFVSPPNMNQLGSDAIAVALIYNSKRVKPVNVAQVFDDQSQKNRVTMAQSFQPLQGGKTFTVIPNHLKSKGSCNQATGLDQDQGDGQACWNATRVKHVQQLISWMATHPTRVDRPNYLLMGDMNSYAKEDPILALEKANFRSLLNDEKIGQGKRAYSYVFGVNSNKDGYGGAGNIDHAIADPGLYPWVKRSFTWAINADEPTVLDYNQKYKTAAQIDQFYSSDAYRSSDHDPVIVDLDFNPQIIDAGNNNNNNSGSGSTSLWSVLGLAVLALISERRRRK